MAGKPIINVVIFNPNQYGGTVTYTAHLYHALCAAGASPMIFKPGGGRGRGKARPFGYGAWYRTAPVAAIAKMQGTTVIAACIGKEYVEDALTLIRGGAFIVIHDPNDKKYFTEEQWHELCQSDRVILIRANNTALVPKGRYIPHPFVRYYRGLEFDYPRPRWAITLSRLGAIKRTTWILEANGKLPERRQIWLRGYEDRFYTYNTLIRSGRYPDFKQDSHLPDEEKRTFGKSFGTAQRLARTATFLVDMTDIQGDGGGTQYTFLEAIDAGCVLLLNTAWVDKPGSIWEPGHNCLVASNADELVDVLQQDRRIGSLWSLAVAAQKILPFHDPQTIGHKYLKFFSERK